MVQYTICISTLKRGIAYWLHMRDAVRKTLFLRFYCLFNLTWLSQTFDCQKLYWPNFYNEETSRKFLDIHVSSQNINLEAKPVFGSLYRSMIGFRQIKLP